MAEGKHPVPFRTRKLSPPAPMVLPGKPGGRVGRRRDTNQKRCLQGSASGFSRCNQDDRGAVDVRRVVPLGQDVPVNERRDQARRGGGRRPAGAPRRGPQDARQADGRQPAPGANRRRPSPAGSADRRGTGARSSRAGASADGRGAAGGRAATTGRGTTGSRGRTGAAGGASGAARGASGSPRAAGTGSRSTTAGRGSTGTRATTTSRGATGTRGATTGRGATEGRSATTGRGTSGSRGRAGAARGTSGAAQGGPAGGRERAGASSRRPGARESRPDAKGRGLGADEDARGPAGGRGAGDRRVGSGDRRSGASRDRESGLGEGRLGAGGASSRDSARRRDWGERPGGGRSNRTTGDRWSPAKAAPGRPARPARPGSRSGSTSRGGEGTRARDRGREPVGGREATGGGVPAGLEAESAAEDAPKVSEVLTEEILDELRQTARPHAFGAAARALADAVLALSEDDPEAAVAAGREAKGSAPRSAAVRELLGISLYQVGEYKAARTELAVVAASAYGDMGQPAAGVALIRRHARWPAQLADHHLRLAYTEGALAERAGDLDAATEAFARVTRTDPGFFDAAERLERLQRAAPD